MDMRKIKKLIELLKATGVAEIEIKEGEESVRISLEGSRVNTVVTQPSMQHHVVNDTPTHAEKPTPKQTDNKHTLKAPMVGTVYLSPTPGTKPFVEIGQKINAGDVICLIEAMKMFNQIEADKSGTIVERLIDNGTPVEFHQPLFLIE